MIDGERREDDNRDAKEMMRDFSKLSKASSLLIWYRQPGRCRVDAHRMAVTQGIGRHISPITASYLSPYLAIAPA